MQLFDTPTQSHAPSAGMPALGTPIPGADGGLPVSQGANTGLSPLAQQLQSHGRGEDTMLIHMTPGEVNGLQALAMAHGGSLTINPHTGLPEAGWLSKLLPTLIGLGLNFFLPGVGSAIGTALGGIGATAGTAVAVGAGTAAITGDLKQGLMAGLGAYGGASLAGGLKGAIAGAAAPVASGTATGNAFVANQAANAANVGTKIGNSVAASMGSNAIAPVGTQIGNSVAASQASQAATAAAAKTGLAGFTQGFSNTAQGLPLQGATAPTGLNAIAAKAAVPLATSGLMGALTPPLTGVKDPQTGAINNAYQGPYYNEERNVIANPTAAELTDPTSSGERKWFDKSVPAVFNMQGQMVRPGSDTAAGTPIMTAVLNPKAKKGEPMYTFTPQPWKGNTYAQLQEQQQQLEAQRLAEEQQRGYAEGGPVHMSAGSFVMPARETAEFGNGSTDAGQQVLSGLGGIPIRGMGNGTSDDIPARIGEHEARVANGEVHFPPEAVRQIGGGSEKRGTTKLYAMMKRAEQSRKQAARGSDAKGLRALQAG
jgi:hypothetical protein